MNQWELQKHNAPQFPDPRDENQYDINIKLIKILHQVWLAKTELENRVGALEAEVKELKKMTGRATRPVLRYYG